MINALCTLFVIISHYQSFFNSEIHTDHMRLFCIKENATYQMAMIIKKNHGNQFFNIKTILHHQLNLYLDSSFRCIKLISAYVSRLYILNNLFEFDYFPTQMFVVIQSYMHSSKWGQYSLKLQCLKCSHIKLNYF